MRPKANQPSLVLEVVVELATKVNQSSACWAPKANPQLGLWVVSKANQPSLVLLEVGGDGTNGDAELRIAGEGGRENSLHQAAESESCPLESQPFFSFLPWSQQGRCPGSLLYQLLLLV